MDSKKHRIPVGVLCFIGILFRKTECEKALQRFEKPSGMAAPKAPLCKGSWIFSASAEKRLRDCDINIIKNTVFTTPPAKIK